MNTNSTNLLGERTIELNEAAVDVAIMALSRTSLPKDAYDLRDRLLKWKNGFSKGSFEGKLFKKDLKVETPKYLYFPHLWTLKLKKAFKKAKYEIQLQRSGVNQPTQYIDRGTAARLIGELTEQKQKKQLRTWLKKYDAFMDYLKTLENEKSKA